MEPEHPVLESSTEAEPARGGLRWLLGVAVAAAVLLALAVGIARLIDLEQYRVLAERELADATGLAVSIDDLDLRLLPTPAARAIGVRIGDADFGGTAEVVTVHPSFARLLEGVIELERIEVHRPAVTLPSDGDTLRSHWDSLDASIKARRRDPEGPPARIRVDIDTITARGATLTMRGDEAPILEGTVQVFNPTSDAIRVEANAEALRFGEQARVHGKATLHREDSRIHAVDAVVTAEGIDLGALTDDPDARWLEIAMTLSCEQAAFPDVAFAVAGELKAKRGAPATALPLAGPIAGNGWWQDGQLILNDLTLDAPGVHAVGDITRYADGLFAVLLETVDLRPAAFPMLTARIPSDTAAVTPGPNASASARDVYFSFGGDDGLTLASLEAHFDGWQVETPRGPVSGLQGSARYDHGAVLIDEIRAEGVTVTGTITPGDANTQFDLRARAALTPALAAMAGLPSTVTSVTGTMTLERVAGTLTPGGGVPDDLVIVGEWSDGAATIEAGAFVDSFSGMAASFRAEGDAIAVDLRGTSGQMGAIALDGSYAPSKHRWQGSTQLDLARAARGLAPNGLPEGVEPLLNAYGTSVFDVLVTLPSADAPEGSVRFARRGAPSLEGTVALLASASGTTLGDIEVTTELDGAALAAWLPEGSRVTGGIPVAFRRQAAAQRFTLNADATAATLHLPPYMNKPSGEALTIIAEGAAGDAGWSPERVTASIGGEQIQLEPRGDRWVAENLSLNLERIAPFLAASLALSGRIDGTFQTNPIEADIRVAEVSVTPAPETQLTAVSGRVRYSPAGFSADALRIQGAGSDCTVSGGLQEGVWRGGISGKRLDLNAVTAVADALRELRGEPEADAQPSGSSAPRPSMEGTIALDEVLYRQALISSVRANLTMRDGIVHITDLNCRPGRGAMRGSVEYAFATADTPARVGLDLAFDEVDTAILDALSTEPPRGLFGTANARMRLATSLPEDGSPLNAMSGEIVFSAVNGSWGRMGMATRVLAVLRTVEVTRLRIPSAQDEGLVYDNSDGRLLFEEGLMTLENFELRNATLQARATGAADWPRDLCDYRIQVMPLESVTGVVSGVPIIGSVAQGVSESGSIRLIADGPATKPNVRLEPGQSINRLRDQIVDSTRSVDERLREGVVDAAGGLIRGLLGN